MTDPVRVVIADDHAVMRVGLAAFLADQHDPSYVMVGEASSGEQTLELVARHAPQLLLLDLSMEGMGGLETTLELRRRGSAVKILVLTQHAESIYVRRLLEAGANGYVVKSARGEDLVAAIRAVLRGGTYVDPSLAGQLFTAPQADERGGSDAESLARLTRRERQVLKLVAEGYSNKEIASALDVAVKTVMAHRANLMDKLGIHNRSKLVQFAIRVGLLPME